MFVTAAATEGTHGKKLRLTEAKGSVPVLSCERSGKENGLRNGEDTNACCATVNRLIYCNEPLAFFLMDCIASGSSMVMLSVSVQIDKGGLIRVITWF